MTLKHGYSRHAHEVGIRLQGMTCQKERGPIQEGNAPPCHLRKESLVGDTRLATYVERAISKWDGMSGLYRNLRPPASTGFQANFHSENGLWHGLSVADFIEPKPKKGRCRVRVPV